MAEQIAQLMQTFLNIERRLTSMEHRVGVLEAKPKKSLPITIDWPKLLPRIVWGLLVVALAATQMLPVQQAIKIIGFLLSS
jgi:hypothetical protein